MSSSDPIYPVLEIAPPGPNQIVMFGIHGPSGKGKSTCQMDLLLHSFEMGWVEGIATNIQVNVVAYERIAKRPLRFKHIRYLTELPTVSGKAIGADEINRAFDGRGWQDPGREQLTKMVDNSRRRQCRLLAATSIRETGADLSLRRSITCVLLPTGKMTTDGYPIYRVFEDYSAYSRYIQDPLRASYQDHSGFHTVEFLKQTFDSSEEPLLDGYPPIDPDAEAKDFLGWGGTFIYNGDGALVSLPKLWLHVKTWNVETKSLALRQGDLERILSRVYSKDREEARD